MKRIQKNSAFTLIELLVVIAIIAILAAILFPVFAQAREKARQTSCLSNQRQIGTGIMMYVQDADEVYPLALGSYGGNWERYGASVPPGWDLPVDADFEAFSSTNWANSTQPYIKSYGVLRCPSGEDYSIGWSATPYRKTPAYSSYSYNGMLQSYPMGQMPAAASVIMVSEFQGKQAYEGVALSNPLLTCTGLSTTECVYKPRVSGACQAGNGGTSVSIYYGTSGTRWIHSNGQNFTFADGHVKFRKLGSQIAPAATDPNVDPFTAYNANGTSNTVWGNGCHHFLFRPDYQP